jgi:hypothetical protein
MTDAMVTFWRVAMSLSWRASTAEDVLSRPEVGCLKEKDVRLKDTSRLQYVEEATPHREREL